MLTNIDIKKLKIIFTTKDDLKDFPTKSDPKGFATKDDLKKYATKEDLEMFTRSIISEIRTVIEMVGEFIGKTKDHQEIINTHEHRLDKLEDKVFTTN